MSSQTSETAQRYLSDTYLNGLRRRRGSERWLKRLGLAAIAVAVLLLLTLFGTIGWQG